MPDTPDATAARKARNLELADLLVEEFVGLGGAEVSRRAMFGGHGIFADGIMFALVTSQGQACLRTGEGNEDDFEAYGSERFDERMPYHTIPPNVRANPGELRAWAEKSLAIARAAKR